MYGTITGENLPRPWLERTACEIGNPPSCLKDEKRPCGNVPWLEFEFPEGIEPTGGHPGEVERGTAGSPDTLGALHDVSDEAQVSICQVAPIIREPSADERLIEKSRPRYGDGTTIETRPSAA